MSGPRGALPALAAAAVLLAPPPLQARPITLAEAIALARAHRPEVREAQIDVQLAGLDLLAVGLQRTQLAIDGHFTEQAQRLFLNAPPALCASLEGLCDAPPRARLYGFSASLDVPLWTGWRLEAGWSRARARQRASRARSRGLLQALALEVTSSYWAARRAQRLSEAAEQALKRQSELAQLLMRRSRVGVTPAADALRAQGAMREQEAVVIERAARRDEAQAQLASVLEAPEADLTPGEDPDRGPLALPALPLLLRESERERPDLQVARAELEAQQREVTAARGALWPQVSLFGRADARNEILGIPQPRLIASVAGGVTVRWQVFDSLSTFQAIRRAQLERERREGAYRRALALARLEVTVAHGRLRAARQRHLLLEEALADVRRALDLLRRRYEAGAALLIEVREAQDELAQLEVTAIENDIDRALAQAALDAARGAPGP